LTNQYYLGQWKLFSSLGTSESAEQRGISVDYAEYLREQKAKGVAYVGDAEMNGDSQRFFRAGCFFGADFRVHRSWHRIAGGWNPDSRSFPMRLTWQF
jgi:hypothetical protein